MDIATATPVEIDTRLAELHEQLARVNGKIASDIESAHYALDERKQYTGRGGRYTWPTTATEAIAALTAKVNSGTGYIHPEHSSRDDHRKLLARVAKNYGESDVLHSRIADLNQVYRERPWSRFFTVPGGHIHSGTVCAGGTIRPTTLIGWNPQLSGKTEADAVAELGPLLCSHCFPSAPVEWTIGAEKPKDPNACDNKELTDEQRKAYKPARMSNYAACKVCGNVVSVTSSLKLRAHKRPKK